MNSGSLHGVYGNGRPKKSRQVDAFLNGAALTDEHEDNEDGGNNIYGGTTSSNNAPTNTAHRIRKVLSASDQQSSWNDQYTDTDVESSLNYNGSDLYGAETDDDDDDDDDIATLETSSSISMSFDGSEQQDPTSSHRGGAPRSSRRKNGGAGATTSTLMNAFGACHPSTMSGNNPYGSSHTNDEEDDEENAAIRSASNRLKHHNTDDGHRRGSHYISDVESSLAGDDCSGSSSDDEDSYVLSTRSYRMSRVLTGSSATNTNDEDNDSTTEDEEEEDGLTMIFNDIDHDLDELNTLVGSSTIGTTTNYQNNHHHDGGGGLNAPSTAGATDAIIAPSNSNSAIEVTTAMTKEQIDKNAAKREKRHYRHSSMPDNAAVFVSVHKEDDPLPVPQAFTISRSFTSSSSSKNKQQLEKEMNQRRARAHLSKGSSDKERTSHVTKNSFMGTKPRSYRPTQSQGSSKNAVGSIASSTASSSKKAKKQAKNKKNGTNNTSRLPPSGQQATNPLQGKNPSSTTKDGNVSSSLGKKQSEDARSKANQVAFQKKMAAEESALQKDPKAMKQMEKQRHKMEKKLVRAGSAKQMETYKALNSSSEKPKGKRQSNKRRGGSCCSNWCCCKLWQIFQQAPCWVKVVLLFSLLVMKGSFAYLGYTWYKNYEQRASLLEQQQQNARRGGGNDINMPLSLESSTPTSEPFISKASSSLRGTNFAGVDPV